MAGRLLVVDDDHDITLVLKLGLEKEGFEVVAFNDPEEALQKFKRGTYDMIVLDIRMPVIDGFTLYQKLRAIDKKFKVIFMTAFEVTHDERFKEMYPPLNEKTFLKKPLIIRTLAKLLKSQLRITD